MICQSRKNGVKSSLNFKRSLISPLPKIINFEARLCRSALLLLLCENRFCLLRFVKKLNSTKRGAFFDMFASPRWSLLCMRTKVVSFLIFFQDFQTKKFKKLRPKITKIASRVLPYLITVAQLSTIDIDSTIRTFSTILPHLRSSHSETWIRRFGHDTTAFFRLNIKDIQPEEGFSIRTETSYPSFWVAGDERELWKMITPARISFNNKNIA